VRVDVGEIRDPVTVVAGGLVARASLHGFILIYRAQPDGRGSQALDVVQARDQGP
jgi:hypothetical protein